LPAISILWEYCKKAGLQAIIHGKVELAATIHTDGFRSKL
jgi:thiamine monophosphate synthase